MLASHSGEMVELKYISVLVAHYCALCLATVLPSKTLSNMTGTNRKKVKNPTDGSTLLLPRNRSKRNY